MKFALVVATLASTLFLGPVAQSSGLMQARIARITSYSGHTGLLVVLSSPHQNPDGCSGSSYYIYPDNAPRAAIVQSMLLSAQMSEKQVDLVVDGCFENYPKIVHVTVNS
jgi:hypothetical protein